MGIKIAYAEQISQVFIKNLREICTALRWTGGAWWNVDIDNRE